jgi:hypothetical protein
VRTAGGEAIGVFGMYQVIDAASARKLFAERARQAR